MAVPGEGLTHLKVGSENLLLSIWMLQGGCMGMELGMVGLGRMGASMVRRLLQAGHRCVVYDMSAKAVAASVELGAVGSGSLAELVQKLERPRTVWLMVPAGVVDTTLEKLVPLLEEDDVIIDGGNSYYHDDIRRAVELKKKGFHYVDTGTSGGVWGAYRGYCLMIGGKRRWWRRWTRSFAACLQEIGDTLRTPGRENMSGTADQGYLHCGLSGAGHFVKMVHNGIEYGMMAAYAEGLKKSAPRQRGQWGRRALDAETTPMRNPEFNQYELNLPDIAEVWRRGSAISSWLLYLVAQGADR